MSGMSGVRRPRGAGHSRVTLREVAERAGVGQMTASRALREPEKVSPELRARVLEAVQALGYVANRVASGLASGTSKVVPVIVPTLTHAVYVPFLHGANEVLGRHGYQVLLATTEYEEGAEASLVDTLLGWYPAGLMVAGVDHLPHTAERLRRAAAEGLPVVEFMDLVETPIDINVGFSHRAVGEAVAHWFADRGHRRVAYAGTLAATDLRSARRAEGFLAVARARGLAPLDLRSEAPFSIGLGSQLLAQLLQREPALDAVFMANDDLAMGAVLEAQRRGVQVGAQLAVMGFNDLEIAAAMRPAISSVAVDQAGMGRRAAQLLLERRAGRHVHPLRVDTGFRIVERESTRPVPGFCPGGKE
jgi:LacI family gluconate utilization system Gnt-I transcriptional repressor